MLGHGAHGHVVGDDDAGEVQHSAQHPAHIERGQGGRDAVLGDAGGGHVAHQDRRDAFADRGLEGNDVRPQQLIPGLVQVGPAHMGVGVDVPHAGKMLAHRHHPGRLQAQKNFRAQGGHRVRIGRQRPPPGHPVQLLGIGGDIQHG